VALRGLKDRKFAVCFLPFAFFFFQWQEPQSTMCIETDWKTKSKEQETKSKEQKAKSKKSRLDFIAALRGMKDRKFAVCFLPFVFFSGAPRIERSKICRLLFAFCFFLFQWQEPQSTMCIETDWKTKSKEQEFAFCCLPFKTSRMA
jgi:hypothetical protein